MTLEVYLLGHMVVLCAVEVDVVGLAVVVALVVGFDVDLVGADLERGKHEWFEQSLVRSAMEKQKDTHRNDLHHGWFESAYGHLC